MQINLQGLPAAGEKAEKSKTVLRLSCIILRFHRFLPVYSRTTACKRGYIDHLFTVCLKTSLPCTVPAIVGLKRGHIVGECASQTQVDCTTFGIFFMQQKASRPLAIYVYWQRAPRNRKFSNS